MERDSGNPNKGFGLFLEEGCRKDDFIIEYTGKVTKKHGSIYSMKINPPPESKGKRETVYIDAIIDGGLAKYINHSCNQTANSYNGMSKDCRACVFLQEEKSRKVQN